MKKEELEEENNKVGVQSIGEWAFVQAWRCVQY